MLATRPVVKEIFVFFTVQELIEASAVNSTWRKYIEEVMHQDLFADLRFHIVPVYRPPLLEFLFSIEHLLVKIIPKCRNLFKQIAMPELEKYLQSNDF